MLPCENSCQLESAADKTRVGDFFSWSPDCAGQTGTQVVDCDWEMEATATTPRQSNSLPKKEKRSRWEQRRCDGAKAVLAGNEKIGDFLSNFLSDTLGLDSNITLGYSGGGTLALPILGALGIGVHGEGGGTFTIDFADPLNTRLSATASYSAMVTGGVAVVANAGPVMGLTEGTPDNLWSVDNHMHFEGGAVYGGGVLIQSDISFKDDFAAKDISSFSLDDFESMKNFSDGFSGSISPRGGVGAAGFFGAGVGQSISVHSPSVSGKLQEWYDKNCK